MGGEMWAGRPLPALGEHGEVMLAHFEFALEGG